MPIHGYLGGVISATAPTISPTSASGVWTLDDQLQNSANWPSQSNIARSLRFNSADSAYLNRTFTTPTNNTTWSFSFWLKRSTLSTQQYFLNVNSYGGIGTNNDSIVFWGNTGLSLATSTAVFRDVSAWYHVMVVSNGTTITAYVNNSSVLTYTGTITNLNSAVVHNIGRDQTSASAYLNGYMADVYFIDGQALTPSSFGYTDSNGIWQPNSYTGSYGTNGFWLNFDDNSGTTATTLGKDSSGNGNNWTPNNFSVTAGAGNDSLVDSPSNYGTDTGVGGEVRGNYCTLNPLMTTTSNATITNGNLDVAPNSINYPMVYGTFGMSSGKWYWEYVLGSSNNSGRLLGIVKSTASITNYVGGDANGWGYYGANGNKYTGGSGSAYGASYTNSDVVGVAFDADAGTLTFYKNGVSQGTAFTGLTSGPYFPAWSAGDAGQSGTTSMNFGQRPFAYTAPAGFKALCSTNLPTPTIQKGSSYFNPVLYTGNGNTTAQAITGTGFQPDWVWIKARDNTYVNLLFDAVRGAGKQLISELANAESTVSNFVSFDSDGFTVNAAGGSSSYNANGTTYVAWNWKANGAGSSNTAGSITSTVSANQTSGFSIVTYTGTGANATVGHGLGAAPQMIIIKTRSASYDWLVYHTSIGNTAGIFLNLSNAPTVATAYFNNTSPTSSVFSLGSSLSGNSSGTTIVAYCFAAVSGFSAFGQYTGNGSTDGPFIYTGFRPAYLLIKRSNDGADWYVYDAKRNTYNALNSIISPDLSSAEATNAAYAIDFTANGFKLRLSTTYANSNASTYIYAAFAESPFKISRAR